MPDAKAWWWRLGLVAVCSLISAGTLAADEASAPPEETQGITDAEAVEDSAAHDPAVRVEVGSTENASPAFRVVAPPAGRWEYTLLVAEKGEIVISPYDDKPEIASFVVDDRRHALPAPILHEVMRMEAPDEQKLQALLACPVLLTVEDGVEVESALRELQQRIAPPPPGPPPSQATPKPPSEKPPVEPELKAPDAAE